MMLTRTACLASRCIGRYSAEILAARRRFAFAKDNARCIDAAHPTSSAVAQSSFSQHRKRTIAIDGSWMTDPPLCSGRILPDTLNSLRLSHPSGLQCRYHSGRVTGTKTPRFSDYQTLEDIVEAAYHHIDALSPLDVAAFWSSVSKIQKQDRRRAPKRQQRFQDRKRNDGQKMAVQLDKLLRRTMKGIQDLDSLDPRCLAQTTVALAKVVENLESRGKGMYDRRPHDQILRGLTIGNNSEIKQCIFDELAQASMPILQEFNARSLSNFIYAFGLVKHAGEFEDGNTVFGVLALAARLNLERFDSQGFSNMLWAYANAGVSNSQLFKNAGDVIERGSLQTFSEQAVSNIVWAYATLNESHPELFKKMAEHVLNLDNMEGFKPQELSNIALAFAKAEESHPQLFERLSGHIISLNDLRRFKPQELSNLVWAYATANESHPKLFQKVANHILALNNLGGIKPQELSNIVWACATAKESHPKLFKKVADNIMALNDLGDFKPQELSNIVWAHATAEEPYPKLFEKIADHVMALNNLEAFIPQNLSNIVWAYAKAHMSHPKLFKKVADHVVSIRKLAKFNPQALSNIVWAYATAKEYQHALFQKIAASAIRRKGQFTSQNVANVLWAYASNGHMDANLFQTLAPVAVRHLDKCKAQHLANIAWAFAVVNISASSLLDEKIINACKDKEHEFLVEELSQLHQWQIWQEELKSGITFPPSLSEKCCEAFVSCARKPSALQVDVISELKAMGLQPEEEVLTKRGYRLDAVVEVNGNKIGVEVDGPSHFLGRRPTGSTVLKHRQVAKVEGLPILSVPYWKWNTLKRDSDKKQKYLCSLLGLGPS